jgi:hypothetical protein
MRLQNIYKLKSQTIISRSFSNKITNYFQKEKSNNSVNPMLHKLQKKINSRKKKIEKPSTLSLKKKIRLKVDINLTTRRKNLRLSFKMRSLKEELSLTRAFSIHQSFRTNQERPKIKIITKRNLMRAYFSKHRPKSILI